MGKQIPDLIKYAEASPQMDESMRNIHCWQGEAILVEDPVPSTGILDKESRHFFGPCF